jgi:cellulose synthase/poly-beta-1,6-N-acetylglucosamine synthase-like glycosyltransferase
MLSDLSELLLWSSVVLIGYAYAGYPLVLSLIAMLKAPRSLRRTPRDEPSVSLLISVYNEEDVIEDRLRNALALNYPKGLLEIVVASDGSTDRTHAVVAGFAPQGIVLRGYDGRIGKTACLNRAVPVAKGDIVVFSDANSRYDREAIARLVAPFSDPQVGCVTGTTRYASRGENDTMVESIGLYSKIEAVTKNLETRLGSCVGADGAIFAIRRSLFRPLRDVDINDLVIPLSIVRQGLRVIAEPAAFCTEHTAQDAAGEFRRQVRIANRTIRAIVNNRDMLNPFRFGFYAFEILSHKLVKLLVPFALLTALACNLILVRHGTLYLTTLGLQAALYVLSLLGFWTRDGRARPTLIGMAHTFAVANAAMLVAWVGYFRGESYLTWTTVRS